MSDADASGGGSDTSAADEASASGAAAVSAAVGDRALRQAAADLGELLKTQGAHVATAESCTGGWIGKVFTDVAGSSRWYNGGVISYSNDAKQGLLGVTTESLVAHGAVSSAVVQQMAHGALVALEATGAVSVSGVAGPGGGTADKPVGLVWIAVARRGRDGSSAAVEAYEHRFAGDRDTVRRLTVLKAIEHLRALFVPI